MRIIRGSSPQATVGATRARTGYLAVALAAGSVAFASALPAQICNGGVSSSSIAYNFEKLSVGTSNGVTGALVRSHFAAGVDYRVRSISDDVSGQEAQIRLTGVLGGSRLKVCPGIRIGLVRDSWDVRSGLSVMSNTIGLGAGVGVGYEQPIYRDIQLIPFVSVGYGFNALAYEVSATNADADVTGDTLSGLAVDYGLLVHYRYVFVGLSASHLRGTQVPIRTRRA